MKKTLATILTLLLILSALPLSVNAAENISALALYTSSYSSLYTDEACTVNLTSESRIPPTVTYTTTGHFFDVDTTVAEQFFLKEANSSPTVNFTMIYDTAAYTCTAIQNGVASGTVKTASAYGFKAVPGTNVFVLRLSSNSNKDNYRDYTFTCKMAYNSSSKLNSAAVSPAERSVNASLLIKGKAEGTLWRMNAAGEITSTSGYSADVYNYTSFLTSDANTAKLTVKTADTLTGHIAYSTDNGITWINGEATTVINNIPFVNDRATVLVKTCSDTSFNKNTDPFNGSAVYTFNIIRLAPSVTADAVVTSLDFGEGTTECTPAFAPLNNMTACLVGHDTETVTVTFTAKTDCKVYAAASNTQLSSASIKESYLLTPVDINEKGENVYTIETSTPLSSNFSQQTSGIAVVYTADNGTEIRRLYNVYYFKTGTTKGVLDGMPDAITDYLCIASQYTNGGNNGWGSYGLFPEKTMNSTGNWNSCISLGNFGGQITYYYENGIVNDEGNPYGIDLTVFGNSNGGQSFSEPGAVSVSEDGVTWYTLAGSEHYDEGAEWDYTVTYKKTTSGGICDYEDSFGNASTLGTGFAPYTYPETYLYTLHDYASAEPDKYTTVSGTRLYGPAGKRGDGIESAGAAALPSWGYADVHTNSSAVQGTGEDVDILFTPVGNPYAEKYNGYGDGFDLEWAVDEKGLPVDVNGMEFHYVKISTCSFINAGIMGEKSTEVSCMVRTKSSAVSKGRTDMPSKITLNGKDITLTQDKNVYLADFSDTENTIVVNTSENTNIYINNERTAERTFTGTPDKNIIRIIVQDGEKAPEIIYLVSSEMHTKHTPGSAVKEMSAASTCIVNGSYDEVIYCTECEKELVRTTILLPLAPHTFSTVTPGYAATCRNEGLITNCTCTVCAKVFDAEHNEIASVVIPKTAHTWDKGETVKEPTATEEGEKVFTCTVCGEGRLEKIPATGITESNDCPKCGRIHKDNFFGRILCFFYRILNLFRK